MNYEKTLTNLTNELTQYLEEHELFSVVVGISGGIDSAMVAAVCSLIPNLKVVGITMPTSTTDPQELANAKAVGGAFVV